MSREASENFISELNAIESSLDKLSRKLESQFEDRFDASGVGVHVASHGSLAACSVGLWPAGTTHCPTCPFELPPGAQPAQHPQASAAASRVGTGQPGASCTDAAQGCV